MNRRDFVCSIVVGALAFAATPVLAQSAERSIAKPPEDKPFAEHFIVLQLSDSDQKKERLVLSVADGSAGPAGAGCSRNCFTGI